ncbi:NAD(P)-binding protein [Arthrobacter sp. CJ23]|uniref:NAD(P)-binding protein n=1 Tax=Arthrobacter sp. CJ23 TaxID=2972479 RepID=UPI00215D1FB0|nr:NAD(P)-binding protein [Arthrobacter sp. CJ23]UVJ40773.1 NAD(P)-binding protein [Arthrobacter sp. CJ23]
MSITDYLVIGAGASGLAFADALLHESDAEVLLVDRRAEVGGHWRDAYSFVLLHTPSAYYGVNSLRLGRNRIIESGRNAGFYEQATGAEVCAYFETVLARQLQSSGRAQFLGRTGFLDHHDGIARIRHLETGEVEEVVVRRRIVDARYQEASVPATHTPSYTVDPDAAFAPVGMLPERAGDYREFIVIGAGKTAADACLWLLDAGTDPDRIRWVRPREMWFTNRAGMQPLEQVASILNGLADDAEAGAHARDVVDMCHRLEDVGRLMRLDPSVEPTMYRGTMLSRPELTALQQIGNVIRLGHVEAVGVDRLRLTAGGVTAARHTLVVDCSARGLSASPPVPIFVDNTIRLQQLRHNSPTFNAALLGFIEAHRDDAAEKNRLAPPNPYANTPRDMASMFTRTWVTERLWQGEADIRHWIEQSRLNLLCGLAERTGDVAAKAAAGRFTNHVADAIARLPQLA